MGEMDPSEHSDLASYVESHAPSVLKRQLPRPSFSIHKIPLRPQPFVAVCLLGNIHLTNDHQLSSLFRDAY